MDETDGAHGHDTDLPPPPDTLTEPPAELPPDPNSELREPALAHRPTRQRAMRYLAAITVVAWTVGAFAAGIVVGTRQQPPPPPPRPDVNINVEQVDLPSTPTDGIGTPTESVMVNVLGLTETDAVAVIGDSGLDPTAVETDTAAVAGEPGVVVAQTPPPGTTNPNGVTLTVSAPAEIPAVTGLTLDEAQSVLEALGAVGRITSAYSKDATPGTILAIEPATGALPSEVTLTVASPPATMELIQLEPVERNSCSYRSEAKVNTVAGTAAMTCELSRLRPGQEPLIFSIGYDVSRAADRLRFTAGFTDDSALDATATMQVLVDGNVIDTQPAAFGVPVTFDIDITNALRLSFQVQTTLPTQDRVSTRVGTFAVIEATLTGNETSINELVEANS